MIVLFVYVRGHNSLSCNAGTTATGLVCLFDWGLTPYLNLFLSHDGMPHQWMKENTPDTTGNKQKHHRTNTGECE